MLTEARRASRERLRRVPDDYESRNVQGRNPPVAAGSNATDLVEKAA